MAHDGFRIDLHVHSRLSEDSAAEPEECIQRAIEKGLQGIAFTEHYSFAASEAIEPLRERYRKSILVVRGVEFSAAEGHCLVFGVDTDGFPRYAPIEEVVRLVNERGGAAVPSHPYRGGGTSIGDRIFSLPGIAAVEGRNGMNGQFQNERALAAAARLGLPVTGGSDAHSPTEVGRCLTVFRERVTADTLPALLRAGHYEAVDRVPRSRGLFG